MTNPAHDRLIGLIGGPPVAIHVTLPEIETLRQMVDRTSALLDPHTRRYGEEVVRELDVRAGAVAELQPDRAPADQRVPLTPDEHATLRLVYSRVTGSAQFTRLMADLDRRIGAAQTRLAQAAQDNPPTPTQQAITAPPRRRGTFRRY